MVENKKSRLDFVYEQFSKQYEKSAKKDKLLNIEPGIELLDNYLNTTSLPKLFNEPTVDNYVDISFLKFAIDHNIELILHGNSYKDAIFNYLLKYDPSQNKEYVNWFVNLYGDLCKERPQISKVNKTNELFSKKTINNEVLFFEDLGKISESLEVFILLKKTNVLTVTQRDINLYPTYKDFVNTIKPYATRDDDDDTEQVHTLTHSEIKSIQNYVDLKDKSNKNIESLDIPLAELIYEDGEWIIVITHNKESNAIFGRNTTWCTAGTRHDSVFQSYDKQGPIFVLIKKGFGARYLIKKNPEVRLQFHFDSNQYMNANDAPIKIDVFLRKYSKVKDFLTDHVVAAVTRMSLKKDSGVLEFLKKLGYADQLVKILKKTMPDKLDLSDFPLSMDTVREIGELISLKELILDDCEIKEIPETFANLTKLEVLQINHNTELKIVPEFITKLSNLKKLDLGFCDIQNTFNVSGLTNLEELSLDNNANLRELPKNIGDCSKIYKLSASNCNISEIDDDILRLRLLYMVDMHYNKNLKKIPAELTSLSDLVACNLDNTKLPKELREKLKLNASSKPERCSLVLWDQI